MRSCRCVRIKNLFFVHIATGLLLVKPTIEFHVVGLVSHL